MYRPAAGRPLLWYGTRTRLAAYVGGLLRQVSPSDSQAIVELTYDAARAAQAAQAAYRSAQERVGEAAPGKPDQQE